MCRTEKHARRAGMVRPLPDGPSGINNQRAYFYRKLRMYVGRCAGNWAVSALTDPALIGAVAQRSSAAAAPGGRRRRTTRASGRR